MHGRPAALRNAGTTVRTQVAALLVDVVVIDELDASAGAAPEQSPHAKAAYERVGQQFGLGAGSVKQSVGKAIQKKLASRGVRLRSP